MGGKLNLSNMEKYNMEKVLIGEDRRIWFLGCRDCIHVSCEYDEGDIYWYCDKPCSVLGRINAIPISTKDFYKRDPYVDKECFEEW